MSKFKHRVLSDHQADIAKAIMAVLHGCKHNDAYAAMTSIIAGTINNTAADRSEAMQAADSISDRILMLVSMGQDGLLEMAPVETTP